MFQNRIGLKKLKCKLNVKDMNSFGAAMAQLLVKLQNQTDR